MPERVERIDPESLSSAITDEDNLIIFIGMYGCEPCQLFEERCDEALSGIPLDIRFRYIKLRPSQFRDLQSRSVIDSVPVAISFKRGKEYKRFAGLPGSISPEDYQEKLLDIIKAIT